jgi:hypothetical protein
LKDVLTFRNSSWIEEGANLAAKVEYYGGIVRVLAIDELEYTAHSREEGDLLFQIISIWVRSKVALQPGSSFKKMSITCFVLRGSFRPVKGYYVLWQSGPEGA